MASLRELYRDRLDPTLARIQALFDHTGGSVSVALAILSPLVIGTVGLAAEASYWQMHQRAMQNASDSAAIAAAMEGSSSNSTAVAQAVAAQYGFVNGSGNIVVTVAQTSSAAGCTSNCYAVAITDQVPLFLRPYSAIRELRPSTKSR